MKSDTPSIAHVMPTDDCQLLIEFNGGEFRLFSLSGPAKEQGYRLSNQWYVKGVRHTADAVFWAAFERFDCQCLYERSTPVDATALRSQWVTLGEVNRAPTDKDLRHHVYAVSLAPFSEHQVVPEESIGGGHAERGGTTILSYEELWSEPVWKDRWKDHFKLAGCEWAVPIIEGGRGDAVRLSWDIIDELKRQTRRIEKPHRAPKRRCAEGTSDAD